MIEILGNATQFRAELEKAVGSTNRANSSFAKFGKAAGVAGGVLVAGLAVGLDKSMHAAVALQASTARLDTAFKNAHLSTKAYQGQIDKVESSSRKLGFTDDDVRGSLGSLLTATGNVHKSMLDLAVAENLARFKHTSLEAATKTLTMAMAGSQRAAKQLGISVPKVTTAEDALKASHVNLTTAAGKLAEAHAKVIDKQLTNAAVIAEVKKKTEGMAGAFAGTAAGSMQIFHAQTQHLEEVLGKTLLPVIVDVMTGLAHFADWMSSTGAPAIKKAAENIAAYFTGIYDSVKSVVDGVTDFFMKLPGRVWDGFSAPWITAYTSIKGAFTDVKKWVGDRITDVVGFFGGMPDRIWTGFTGAWNVAYTKITGAFDEVKTFASGLIGKVAGFFTSLPGDIVDAITGAFGDLEKGIKDLFSWKKIVGWIKDALLGGSPSKPLMDVGRWMIESIVHGVGDSAGVLKNAVERIAMDVLSAFPGSSTAHPSPRGGGPGLGGSGGLVPQVTEALGFARAHGWHGVVTSGFRTYAEQAALYDKYLHGGPLAAPPGHSSHETGQAVDVTDYQQFGRIMAIAPGFERLYNRLGARDPVHYSVTGYAQGGIVTQPTLALIGERGPEAVVPLSRGGMGGGVHVHLHSPTIIGTNLEQAGRELAEPLRRELLRIQKRNGTLGFT